MKFEQWNGFYGEEWQNEVNVRQFIQDNYTPYTGDASFLAGPTARTSALMDKLNVLFKQESDNGGLLDIDTMTVSSLTSYAPGYLDKEKELVGMYLSAHPLDPYYMEINYGCSHNIKTYLEETPADGKELSFGGMVVSFEAKPTKSGGQFGIMKIEDYNGSTELRFFGQDFIIARRNML